MDATVLAVLASLAIPGGTAWVDPKEVHCVTKIIWHEARDRHLDAQAGVAFAALDRAAHAGKSVCATVRVADYPWAGPGNERRRETRVKHHFAERVAWEKAVMIALFAYVSSDELPLLARPCPGNPTHFDRWLKPSRWRAKDKWKLPEHGKIECWLDGVAFWSIK